MSKLVELNKQTTTSCESMVLARTQETPGSSIKDVMQLVKACGPIAGSKEHFQWLSMKYEWMTMNKKGKLELLCYAFIVSFVVFTLPNLSIISSFVLTDQTIAMGC
jgi:hypothetical protein